VARRSSSASWLAVRSGGLERRQWMARAKASAQFAKETLIRGGGPFSWVSP
jgi:hypothetical protein